MKNFTHWLKDIDIYYRIFSFCCFARVSSLFNILLLLLRDSSNFKVRIQAAAALSVPASVYGKYHVDTIS